MEDSRFTAGTNPSGEPIGQFFGCWSPAAAEFMREHCFRNVAFEGKFGDLAFLEEFSGCIEWINVVNEDARTDGVSKLENLRFLQVVGKTKKPVDFSRLGKLSRCNISWHNEYGTSLFGLESLQSLFLHHYSALDFCSVARNTSIRDLRLAAPKLVGCEGIGQLAGLESLNMQRAAQLKSFDGLEALPQLQALFIENAAQVGSCSPLGKLRSLEHLSLISVGGATSTGFVLPLQKLTALAITGIVTQPDWKVLLSLPNLERLTLYTKAETLPSFEVLSQLGKAAGKIVTNMDVAGKKKEPLVTITFES
jgi:hypothetical protein